MSLLSFFTNGGTNVNQYNNANMNYNAANNRITNLLIKYNNKLILPNYGGDSQELISFV